MIDPNRFGLEEQRSARDVRRRTIELRITQDPGTRRASPTQYAVAGILVQANRVIVVVGIHEPAQFELLEVVQADDGLAFGLRFGQRGQEHAG